ncbi:MULTISPECIES: DUF397 domain-containing protein [Actinomadura]|uniref:DUF397 domain-containing protein n=1 Tax=Actinomadura yumaensis TaxID=111807 RepID=A0ABW2CCN9_9ACTN|nr:DUF397 domain-containing protein [Actinomadura sp. J1-007]MWK33382.1 DUF397 domain-containing protein [Actinomadura sp. J1-007]
MNLTSRWRKSTYSDQQGGACVELAALASSVGVRDSTDPAGPRLEIAPDAFAAFIARVKDGGLDL